jgi:hypothetical protein
MSESALAALAGVTETAATRLAAAGIHAADITAGRVSRADLLAAGLDRGDADRIRRAHGLAWSFYVGDSDLVRRAARVRGLTTAERAWVAASAADWEGATAERAASSLAAIPGVSEDDAAGLAAAGVTSPEELATAAASDLADVLGVDVRHLRTWRALAREQTG